MIGGGTYAATTAFAVEPAQEVQHNPLYQQSGDRADNPLWDGQTAAP
jgi:hypothetical protein